MFRKKRYIITCFAVATIGFVVFVVLITEAPLMLNLENRSTRTTTWPDKNGGFVTISGDPRNINYVIVSYKGVSHVHIIEHIRAATMSISVSVDGQKRSIPIKSTPIMVLISFNGKTRTFEIDQPTATHMFNALQADSREDTINKKNSVDIAEQFIGRTETGPEQ